MTPRRAPLFLAFAAASLLAFWPLAHADDDGDGDDDGHTIETVRKAVESGEIRPLSELKGIVKARYPGDIVRIRSRKGEGAVLYEFRVLQADGNVIEIKMDAARGKILEVENE